MKNKLSLAILLSVLPLLSMASTIGDKVWLDSNQDWEQSKGEKGLANITVQLLDDQNILIKSTITDKNGNYQFRNIQDKEYSVRVIVPSGYVSITPKLLSFWEEKDLNNLDFGLYKKASFTIGNTVWNDKNEDWEQNYGEKGLANVTVELYDKTSKKIQSVKTNSKGTYAFKNVSKGEYSVKVVPQKGQKVVTSQTLELWVEEDRTDMNFGLYQEGFTIGNTVWNDKNEDWEQNYGEKGLANVTVELYDKTSKKIQSVKTNSKGTYAFKNVSKGEYSVKVVPQKGQKVVTSQTLELWVEEDRTDMNFGLFTDTVTPPDLNKPITRVELNRMIANGDDVTQVNTSKITDMSRLFYENTTFNQDISSWDTSNVTNMNEMFYKAHEFNQPIGSWNVSKVSNMSRMFYRSSIFNQDISSWDTSNVTNMNEMFYRAESFNQPIGSWNVSKVRNMSRMFAGKYITYVHKLYSTPFNQDLSNWDVSNVQTMYRMFYGCHINQDLSNWDVANVTSWKGIFEKILVRGKPWVKMDESNKPKKFLEDLASEELGEKENFYGNYSKPPTDLSKPITRARLVEMITNQQDVTKVNTSKITDMSRLFYDRTKFNQDISEWDTSNVINMKEMFKYAYDFNQPIGKWDVSNVTDMSSMFQGYYYRGRVETRIPHKFNQNLSNWDVSNVTDMTKMFTTSNFNQNIRNWDVSNVLKWRYIFSSQPRPTANHGNMKKENMPEKLFNLEGE